MMRLRHSLMTLFTIALVNLSAAVPTVAAGPASQTIETLNAKFLEVMKAGSTLGYAGRYKELEPALTAAFDFADMTRVSVGRYWNDLTDAQKAQLVEAFRAYSVATYAARFNSFSGQKFAVLGEEPARGESIRVNNQIVTSKGEPIRIDYLMKPRDGGYKVVDVYLKSSVSELAVRRSEYSSVYGKQGFDGLLAALQARTAAVEKEAETASSD